MVLENVYETLNGNLKDKHLKGNEELYNDSLKFILLQILLSFCLEYSDNKYRQGTVNSKIWSKEK